jgi:IMP dehydrogenase
MDLRTGLSYDDVFLVPQRSPVDSRGDVDTSTTVVPGVKLEAPILSAAMDTVTEAATARALAEAGGLGVVHRFQSIAEQAADVEAVADAGLPVAGAVGVDEAHGERAAGLVAAGADLLVVDVAHGHMERCLDVVADLASGFDVPLCAGNVATPAGVTDLAAAGADCVKVGVGPGAVCTTREVAGAGVPQFTAVVDCAAAARERGVTTVADGGIRTSGDAAKALVAGADAVMMGSFFAGTDEAPGRVVERDGRRYKYVRGMASSAAGEARSDKADAEAEVAADEGVEALTEYRGPLAEAVEEFCAGIRSGLSYCGAHTLAEARDRGEFVRVTGTARARAGAHDVDPGVSGPERDRGAGGDGGSEARDDAGTDSNPSASADD